MVSPGSGCACTKITVGERKGRRNGQDEAVIGPSTPQSPTGVPTCYWHPNRTTQLRCTRCDRPICPDCMRTAAVGQHCVECVRAGARSIRQPRTQFGGRERSATPVVTYALIAINVLAFVLQISVRGLQSKLVLWP